MLSKPPSAVPPPLAFRPPVSRVLSLLENFEHELLSFEYRVVVFENLVLLFERKSTGKLDWLTWNEQLGSASTIRLETYNGALPPQHYFLYKLLKTILTNCYLWSGFSLREYRVTKCIGKKLEMVFTFTWTIRKETLAETHFELLMRDMEAFLVIAMQESIAVRKEERSSTEVRFSPFPSGLNLLEETRLEKVWKSCE